MPTRYDVCMAVVSDLAFDARVWKEARSVAGSGRSVLLIGCAYEIDRTRERSVDGIDVVEVPLGSRTGSVSPLKRAATLLGLWLRVLRAKADAYHSHNVHPGLPMLLASRLRRAGLVYDAHELYGEGFRPERIARLVARGSAALERLMVGAADAVITTNPSRAKVLNERYGRDDVVVLGNVPMRVDDVEPLDPGYPAERRTLLYQGGIYAHSRAFREAIQALHELDDVDLIVLGFGREGDLELIREWAREEGLADRVHLLPPRPFDELVRTAAAATVGLVPIRADNVSNSLGDTNKLYEYLMAGLPMAASDLPEIRRVATAGDPPVGEVFDPASPQSLATAVRRILDDPAGYEARRREARRLALEQFNWQEEERKLLAIYSPLVPLDDGSPSSASRSR
ncbi:MAG: glycosyltransferase family 4 protein [Actinomycetota bacterium]|nr:glycosyltransferase family 4 protein [Actinomycetota bacterium]